MKCFHFPACKGTEAPVQLKLSITCNSGLQIQAYSGPRRETPDHRFSPALMFSAVTPFFFLYELLLSFVFQSMIY